jgi:putative phage-type endonuclease
MAVQFHSLVQGTPEWHAFRKEHNGSSEASAMMGESSYKTRTQLLNQKKTGMQEEVCAATQARFEDGHRTEELARHIREAELDDDLFPVVITNSKYPGLSASLDGRLLDGSMIWEHKSFNKEKLAVMQQGQVPPTDFWQVVQQLLLSEAAQCEYVISDGTTNNRFSVIMTQEEAQKHEKALLDGWAQFEADLQSHETVIEAVAPVAQDRTTLPSVNVKVHGEVSIVDNFSVFGTALRDFIENKLVRDPQDDQDFADLEEQVKTLKKAEQALQDAERMIISSVDAIEQAQKQKDMLYSLARDNRLMAEKLVKAKKDEIKLKILNDANANFAEYIAELEAGLGKLKLPTINPNVADAMKNKRTILSLRDAADTAVAQAKIEAKGIASRMSAGREILAAKSEGYEFLFRDAAELVMKEAEALEAIIALRISEHKQAEEAKLEAERERIRAEEEAKAQAEAERIAEAERQKIRAEEQAKAEEAARIEREAASQSEVKATVEQVESEDPAPYITETAKQTAKQEIEQAQQQAPIRAALPEQYPAYKVVDAVCKYFDTDGETAKQMIIQAAKELA